MAGTHMVVKAGRRLPRNFDMKNLGELDPDLYVTWLKRRTSDIAEPGLIDSNGGLITDLTIDQQRVLFRAKVDVFFRADPPLPLVADKQLGIPYIPMVLYEEGSCLKRDRAEEEQPSTTEPQPPEVKRPKHHRRHEDRKGLSAPPTPNSGGQEPAAASYLRTTVVEKIHTIGTEMTTLTTETLPPSTVSALYKLSRR